MARRIAIPSKEAQLKIVGKRDSMVIPRIQRLTMNAERASTDIDELGNRLHAGTTEDTPAVTATFQSMDVGIKLFSVLTGTDYTAYPAEGVSVTELTNIDMIIQIKSDTVEDYVKMAHARNCVIRDFAFNYSVDGEATEEYTIIGTEKRWFRNDIVVEKFTTGTTSFTLAETPIQLTNGNYVISAVLDGVYLEEVSSGPATGQYSVSGTTLTTSDSRTSQLLVAYQAAPTGTNWADISEADMPAAIRGIDIPVKLMANGIDRVQSVSLNGSFNPEAVREMGNRDLVGYQMQNVTVNGSITVLDTDTELVALFTKGELIPTATEYSVSEFTASGISLELQLQDPADKEAPFSVLKTVYVPEIVITSEGFTSNVNSNATQSFDFKSKTGEVTIFSGARA